MIMILLVVLPKMQALCNHTEQASDLSLFFSFSSYPTISGFLSTYNWSLKKRSQQNQGW